MENTYEFSRKLTVKKQYDVIVAGGGVAGVAAAISAAKRGASVLLLEKSNILGGLATLGHVNYFVPMCNGRGKQICFGFAEKWLRESAKYGYDTIPEEWKNGEPDHPTTVRYTQLYSPYLFAFQMTEMVLEAGVDLLYDIIASYPVMEDGHCAGVITDSKSGLELYACRELIDTTGDADLLRRSGMPTVEGINIHSYFCKMITLDGCRKALEKNDIQYAYSIWFGHFNDIYGKDSNVKPKTWVGLTAEDVTDYLVEHQIALLNQMKEQPRLERDPATITLMPDFRNTCRIDGDYTVTKADCYHHFEDSVCVSNDFSHRDVLMEVPFRALTRHGFDNMITAGRSVSGDVYGQEILRVIPPAILTGQAAGEAAVLAIEEKRAITDVTIPELQKRLEAADVMVHFPDDYLPDEETLSGNPEAAGGHLDG